MESVDLHPLKAFAVRNLPHGSALRTVILSDNDFVDAREFVGKVKVWLLLFKIDLRGESLHAEISPLRLPPG